jgi:hypothetical protein
VYAFLFILIILCFIFIGKLDDNGNTKVLNVIGHIIIWASFIGGFFAGLGFFLVWLIGGMIGASLIEK